ncbi:hypothetical protein IAT38_005110 [Cryptococcus sp. DSM 104549]
MAVYPPGLPVEPQHPAKPILNHLVGTIPTPLPNPSGLPRRWQLHVYVPANNWYSTLDLSYHPDLASEETRVKPEERREILKCDEGIAIMSYYAFVMGGFFRGPYDTIGALEDYIWYMEMVVGETFSQRTLNVVIGTEMEIRNALAMAGDSYGSAPFSQVRSQRVWELDGPRTRHPSNYHPDPSYTYHDPYGNLETYDPLPTPKLADNSATKKKTETAIAVAVAAATAPLYMEIEALKDQLKEKEQAASVVPPPEQVFLLHIDSGMRQSDKCIVKSYNYLPTSQVARHWAAKLWDDEEIKDEDVYALKMMDGEAFDTWRAKEVSFHRHDMSLTVQKDAVFYPTLSTDTRQFRPVEVFVTFEYDVTMTFEPLDPATSRNARELLYLWPAHAYLEDAVDYGDTPPMVTAAQLLALVGERPSVLTGLTDLGLSPSSTLTNGNAQPIPQADTSAQPLPPPPTETHAQPFAPAKTTTTLKKTFSLPLIARVETEDQKRARLATEADEARRRGERGEEAAQEQAEEDERHGPFGGKRKGTNKRRATVHFAERFDGSAHTVTGVPGRGRGGSRRGR